MSQLVRRAQNLEGPITEYFALESIMASTRSGDLYKAIDRQRGEPIFVWILRNPLPLNSKAAEDFLSRLKEIQHIPSFGSSLLFFGIDNAGLGFAVLPPLDGNPLVAATKFGGRGALAESERRFTTCVRELDLLHRAGITAGDLTAGSFWVDRNGEVQFIGFLGPFDADAVSREALPPVETIHYLAPEQSGHDVRPESDVFALGVLGYYLLTGTYPYGDTPSPTAELDPSLVQSFDTLLDTPPVWAEEVLRRCVSIEMEARYPNAGAVIQAISDARQRALDQAGLPQKRQTEAVVKKNATSPANADKSTTMLSRGPVVGRSEREDAAHAEAPDVLTQLGRLKLFVAVVAVFMVSLLVASNFVSRSTHDENSGGSDIAAHRAAAGTNPEIQQAIDAIAGSDKEVSELAKKFENLVASDDPLAHVILVKSAVEARTAGIRDLAERALLDRTRRLGMVRSAEQLKQYLRTVPTASLGSSVPASYEPLLKAVNATLPLEAREAELRRAYTHDARSTLRLAASIALDSPDGTTAFQPLVSQLVGDSLQLYDAANHSTLALILAHPELGVAFGDDVVQRKSDVSDADVLWLLKLLGDRNDFHVRAFASLAVERGILPPLRRYYLNVVSEMGDRIPPDVVNVLVRASSGSILIDKDKGINDVATVGQWEDQEVNRLLLNMAADTDRPDVHVEVFDTLAARVVNIQPSGQLLDWVRRSHWDNRASFTKAIGVMASLSTVTPEGAAEAFKIFQPHLADQQLLKILLNAKDTVITRLILESYSGSFDLGTLLNLLGHPDPEVRKRAIPPLGKYNDVGAMKIILEYYGSEKDESVKNLYRDTFWFVREREARR